MVVQGSDHSAANWFTKPKSFKKYDKKIENITSIIPKRRTDLLKWNGWGYNDSKFSVKNGVLCFTGKRYAISDLELPFFTDWVKTVFNIQVSQRRPLPGPPTSDEYPESKIPQNFLKLLEDDKLDFSTENLDRLVRSHGQTLHDIYVLNFRKGKLPRMPDVVVWPKNHDEVAKVIKLCDENNIVIIPYGGGTSVSGAMSCPQDEFRPILALDTSQMNNVLWLDKENLLICCQSGLVGQDLEEFLKNKGFTTGHEPDSYEFSTVGGWVATRASGMKKNVYGNIEDLMVSVRFLTPKGELKRPNLCPRQSTGPDLTHVVLGSEGTLGVVTDVVLKIRPLPPVKKYGSIVFPDFEAGVKCMREVAYQRCQPASIRLMDNEQFRLGQTLRPKPGVLPLLFDSIKKCYITTIKRFNLNTMCVATLLFEGNKADVEAQERKLYNIAKEVGGIPAGEKNGERGYMLTFVIAYIRDIGLEFNVVAESFETSVPWDDTLNLCKNVKFVVNLKCQEMGIRFKYITHRVTQTYDSGCCVYFYFAFNWTGLADPCSAYEEIERCARQEILRCGGSLSHHHGVGKLRAQWYPQQISSLGVDVYLTAKKHLDPNNIFALSNLVPQNKQQDINLKSKL